MVLFPFITKDGATRVPPRRWNPGRAGYSQGAAHGKGPEMKGTRRPQRVGRGLPAPRPPTPAAYTLTGSLMPFPQEPRPWPSFQPIFISIW